MHFFKIFKLNIIDAFLVSLTLNDNLITYEMYTIHVYRLFTNNAYTVYKYGEGKINLN